MTVTTTKLSRAAGLAAVVAGLLFIAVQINHPPLDAALVSTTEWALRQSAKVLMAVLALAGVTGMYLHQVRRIGVFGLVAYLVFGAGYLALLGVELIGLCVLPSVAVSAPGYVDDVLAVATGGTAGGDIGPFAALSAVSGATYIGGGVLFGLALLRAGVLARWASALLAVGALATAAIPFLPQINQRLFAVPVAVALIGLGFSLWRGRQSAAAGPSLPTPGTARLDPADV
ncbi:hypothetical protein [Pseudonocardia abyssalis]|jgi:hypothetical protein|uniref:DUF4386 family protein n=1 Tax=Pseudonocardia abyssalis TaxID=2792008 RepID=A0ABS6UMY8_9PSEU|nr:hypothetical protein [Pseudonocardia abyssalis]MBW0117362.1 hypothetical protein [Pseudonocardia abyssalis]MBW0133605.1 hypothetical protein [Pseudonocardia abyssalis]